MPYMSLTYGQYVSKATLHTIICMPVKALLLRSGVVYSCYHNFVLLLLCTLLNIIVLLDIFLYY